MAPRSATTKSALEWFRHSVARPDRPRTHGYGLDRKHPPCADRRRAERAPEISPRIASEARRIRPSGRKRLSLAVVVTLSDELAVDGQSLLAASGQILLAAHTRAWSAPVEPLAVSRSAVSRSDGRHAFGRASRRPLVPSNCRHTGVGRSPPMEAALPYLLRPGAGPGVSQPAPRRRSGGADGAAHEADFLRVPEV